MSITVRLWTPEQLEQIKTDDWLATVFMNGGTYSAEEIKHYPYPRRREYLCLYDDGDGGTEDVRIYATGVYTLRRFIEAEYNTTPLAVHEVKTVVTEVTF